MFGTWIYTQIKITKNALTGKEIFFLYEKHSDKIAGGKL